MAISKETRLKIWRLLPEPVRSPIARYIIRPLSARYRRAILARPAQNPVSDDDAPLVVAGLFRTASGIGEGARSTYRALRDEGKNPIAVCVSDVFGLVDMESPFPLSQMPQDRRGTLILHLNSPETPKALEALDMKRGKSWYVIGFWAWELPIFPPGWDQNFDLVSAIWTPSTFVTDALSQHPKAPPVETKGHPVYVPEMIEGTREQFGLPKEARVYITFADSLSSLDRKNPFAAIRYFKNRHDCDSKTILLIKTRNLETNTQAKTDLESMIGNAENIRLMNCSLTEVGKWELLNSIDCLISLHRSEGFGLPIAEAIALGKEVVVTAWSGNMDFCTPQNATLIDYDLVPCVDRYGRYNYEDAHWAEPRV